MKALLLVVWLGISAWVALACWASGNHGAAMVVVMVNGVLLMVINASLRVPTPPKLSDQAVISRYEPSPPSPERSSDSVSVQGGHLIISHMGFQQYEAHTGLALYVDGQVEGEIGVDPVRIPVRSGRHSIQARMFMKPPKDPGGKILATVMGSVFKSESPEVRVDIDSGRSLEVICKREQEGMSAAKLVLLVKQHAAAQASPDSSSLPPIKQCPMCAEDIRQAAVLCKHCGHTLSGGTA